MRRAEVHVVIEYRPTLMRIFQKTVHLRTNHRIHRIERAIHHDIVRLDFRKYKIDLVVRMILIEDVFGIILFIQEG
jgi:hypothetical protein